MSELKVLELFAGIGACSKALERLGIPHTIVDAVEVDKYAIQSFNAVHGTSFEPQDITKWDKDLECDLIMHGSPCQDFSIAGKQAGGDEGSGTRSSLLYETLRIVNKLKPKYVIWENVKNLLSKKHRHNFDAYLKAMEELGYTSTFKVLNAKDYNVPQNRERVFTVSIRERERQFEWPEPVPLERKLKNVLEGTVDKKYYLSDERLEKIVKWEERQKENGRGFRFDVKSGEDTARAVTTSGDRPSTTTYVAIKTANKQGYDMATDGDGIDCSYPDSTTKRGRVGHGVAKTIPTTANQGVMVIDDTYGYDAEPRRYDKSAPTIRSGRQGLKVARGFSIRKLTPKECWRLMGFDDEDFEKAEKVCSNNQLYKQAGNSIVVNVLEAILGELLKETA